MKTRIVLAVMFVAVFLPGGMASADPGGISGLPAASAWEFWGGASIELSVHQVDPLTHEAKGYGSMRGS